MNTRNFSDEINKIEFEAEKYLKDFLAEKRINTYEYSHPLEIAHYDLCGGLNHNVIKSLSFNVIDDTLSFNLYDDDKITCYDIVNGMVSLVVDTTISEIKDFYNKVNEQHELVKQEPTYSLKFFFLPDKYNPRNLDDNTFATQAFKYGSVLSMEEYVKAFNSSNLNNIHPDNGDIRIIDYVDTIVEYCPHCECEVVIPSEFKIHKCPVCGKNIIPCNLCKDCSNHCPLVNKN